MKQIKECQYCGAKDIEDGGKEKLQLHHLLGRNHEDSEKNENKIWLCFKHHQVSECKDWIKLPFTNYIIQGKLFDFYIINYDREDLINYIIYLIENEKKYLNLWRKT